MIAANLGFLWKGLPLTERIRRAEAAGFDAVEVHDDAQAGDLGEIRAALEAAGLPLLGLNARMGARSGCAGIPELEDEARADIDAAIAAARALGGTAVHVLAGVVPRGAKSLDTYRANLSYACERAGDLTVLIEPLSEAAKPGYLVSTVEQAAETVEAVGARNLRIMFDVFHVAQAGGEIVETYRRHAGMVGHVQIADPVSRAEPEGLGGVIAGLREAGYAGALGAEYVPSGEVEDRLGWMGEAREAMAPRA